MKDVLSWLVHSAGMLVIMVIVGLFTTSYSAGYAFGLCVYFYKEVLENGTVEIWKWKFDSIMDFVCPLLVGGLALRCIERIIEWLYHL